MENAEKRSSPRWRRGSKRGVSPIIATILLVAITVVLAAVLYILISGLTKGPGNTPIGTALSFGPVGESSAGAANFYYNTTVQTAGAGMTMGNMIFQVQTSGGSTVTVAGGTITVLGPTLGCNLAVYTFSTGVWTTPAANKCAGQTGSTAPASQGDLFNLYSTATLQSLGYKLVVIGEGSYSGTVSVAIP